MFNSDQIRSLDKNMLVVMSTGEPSTYTHRWFQSHSIEKQEEEEKKIKILSSLLNCYLRHLDQHQ